MKHTKEPWHVAAMNGPEYPRIMGEGLYIFTLTGKDCNANAKRIVSCVNALSGIEDPEKWVKDRKWIDVNERLPESGQRVILLTTSMYSYIGDLYDNNWRIDGMFHHDGVVR